MGLSAFFRALVDTGRVGVDPYRPTIPRDEWTETDSLLREYDATRRRDFPGDAPPLVVDVAWWATEQFYRACQFAVYRDLDAQALTAVLSVDCPAAEPAARHYTVDLVYRFLPDLLRLAKSAAEADPLCDRLREWAAQWPLSSVGAGGIKQIDPEALAVVCEHPGLLRVYVDRILATGDVSRLAEPRVRAAVQVALGMHGELAPTIFAALKKYNESNLSAVVAS
jgi:hypothetical protein